MAHQLQKTDNRPSRHPKVQQFVLRELAHGRTIKQMAKKASRGDPKKFFRWYMIIVGAMNTDLVQEAIFATAQAEAMAGLRPSVTGAGRRAAAGRMDGVRWIGEVTGFHNPRVRHEHSGEVQININMPRPKADPDEAVVDAEVLED